ncbi:NAD(+)/NADH kinase [Pseudonocardia lacus]|uniref:NAD(+)/NADH kinase n=1 Tax=Pseudonocardia lacus TaxID=2835865 RepID=UPI001BDC13A2|nr:NAD(+)/NADH kinase [Pseudonocardia lacus]
MQLRTLGLVVHGGKSRAAEAAEVARAWAARCGVTCAEIDVWSGDGRLSAAEEAARAGHPELVVTIGGDGTFLRGARIAVAGGAAVLGVDVGRVGFLTVVEADGLTDALDAVLADRYEIDERLTLTMCASRPLAIPPGIEALLRYGRGPALPAPQVRPRVHGDPDAGVPLEIHALNDVVFEKLARDRQASVAIFVDGRRFVSYSADAVIVSTPTGSTAYSFAAGGPVLSPALAGLVLTPVAPHMSFNRSLVLAREQRVAVQVLERSGQVAVSVDGALRGVLDPGDWVSVHADPVGARLVRLDEIDFLGRVRTKLGLADAAAAVADSGDAG